MYISAWAGTPNPWYRGGFDRAFVVAADGTATAVRGDFINAARRKAAAESAMAARDARRA